MTPAQLAFLGLILVLFGSSALGAVAAAEAVDWIENQNQYLKKNDSTETPTVLIGHNAQKYWLVPVIAEQDLATFFPVFFGDKAVSVNDGINRELFSTARFLREYLPYKNQVQTNKTWFIGSDNAFIISKLVDDLQSAQFSLNNLKYELDKAGVSNDIDSMKASLNQMADTAGHLSGDISASLTTESDFLLEPTTDNDSSIKDSFAVAFDSLLELEGLAREYREMENDLKTTISTSEKLAAFERNNLIPLASAPPSLYTIGSKPIGNWVIIANENRQSVNTIYSQSKALPFLDSAVLEFKKRNELNETYQGIFGTDPEFSASSGSPSLKLALDDLQLPDKKTLWKNQEQLRTALLQYQSAVDLLNSEEFELSKVATQKSKTATLNVLADGFLAEETNEFDPQSLFNVAVIGFVLVILVYALKNRGNIMGAISGSGTNETEMDPYGWNKK